MSFPSTTLCPESVLHLFITFNQNCGGGLVWQAWYLWYAHIALEEKQKKGGEGRR